MPVDNSASARLARLQASGQGNSSVAKNLQKQISSSGTLSTTTPTSSVVPPTPVSNVPVRTYNVGETTAKTPVAGTPTGVVTREGAYNPITGGTETVNPTAAVNTGAYSPAAKQALWNQSGNTGSASMDAFYRKDDGSLGIKPEYVKSTDPNSLTDVNSVNAYLSGLQNTSFTGSGGNTASTDYIKLAESLSTALGGTAPTPYNSAETLTALQIQYGVTDLQSQLTELEKQARDIAATNRARTNYAEGKPVEMGVIGGRVSEIDRQDQERLDAVNRDIAYVTSQLNSKNSIVKGIMDAKQQDYDTASKAYDSEFSKNLQIITLARGISQDQQTAEQKKQDNAQANINTIYNTITSGGLDLSTMSASQKANISTLELQAGLPVGFVNNLYQKNPKGDIVYSGTETLADGNSYFTVITKDKTTGKMSTDKILIGKAKNPTGSSASSKVSTAEAKENKATEKELLSDVSKQVEKLGQGIVDFNTAHATIYAKYASYLASQGASDDEIKAAIHNALGGK